VISNQKKVILVSILIIVYCVLRFSGAAPIEDYQKATEIANQKAETLGIKSDTFKNIRYSRLKNNFVITYRQLNSSYLEEIKIKVSRSAWDAKVVEELGLLRPGSNVSLPKRNDNASKNSLNIQKVIARIDEVAKNHGAFKKSSFSRIEKKGDNFKETIHLDFVYPKKETDNFKSKVRAEFQDVSFRSVFDPTLSQDRARLLIEIARSIKGKDDK
jgi:hypothetical protein